MMIHTLSYESSSRAKQVLFYRATIWSVTLMKVRKQEKSRNRYNQISSHLTQNTIWESSKTQENIMYKRAKR